MRLPFTLLLTVLTHYSVFAITPAKRYYSTHNYYVLGHDPTTGASLAEVAQELGVEVVEQAGELQHHWLLRAEKSIVGRDVSQDKVLLALERLRSRTSQHRESFLGSRSAETQHAKRLASSIVYFSPQIPRLRIKRAPPPIPTADPPLNANGTARAVALRLGIQDPLFDQQWHIINEESPQHMMNVTTLWDMGITGKNVISALVDDGLDYRSVDIAENFVRSHNLSAFPSMG
jgi:kexin